MVVLLGSNLQESIDMTLGGRCFGFLSGVDVLRLFRHAYI